jgi:hypothetical protein
VRSSPIRVVPGCYHYSLVLIEQRTLVSICYQAHEKKYQLQLSEGDFMESGKSSQTETHLRLSALYHHFFIVLESLAFCDALF